MLLKMSRFAYLETCTLGWMFAGALKLATIERPWVPNPAGPGGKRQTSCVPDGTYNLRTHSSEKYSQVYALLNSSLGVFYQPEDVTSQVWGRSAILIHAGNKVADVIGCIAIGETHGMMGNEHAVLSSQLALNRLRQELGRVNSHQLVIEPFRGTIELVA